MAEVADGSGEISHNRTFVFVRLWAVGLVEKHGSATSLVAMSNLSVSDGPHNRRPGVV
jgi:hypothetical protein